MSEIKNTLPTSQMLTINGEDIIICAFKYRHLASVAEPIAIIGKKLMTMAADKRAKLPAKMKTVTLTPEEGSDAKPVTIEIPDDSDTGIDMSDIAIVVLESIPQISKIIEVSTGKPEDWVGDLELDQLLEVVTTVVTVNRDFFFQRLLPIIAKVTSGLLDGAKS